MVVLKKPDPERLCSYCGHSGRWTGPCPSCGPESEDDEDQLSVFEDEDDRWVMEDDA